MLRFASALIARFTWVTPKRRPFCGTFNSISATPIFRACALARQTNEKRRGRSYAAKQMALQQSLSAIARAQRPTSPCGRRLPVSRTDCLFSIERFARQVIQEHAELHKSFGTKGVPKNGLPGSLMEFVDMEQFLMRVTRKLARSLRRHLHARN
jgi:hypothetical protein